MATKTVKKKHSHPKQINPEQTTNNDPKTITHLAQTLSDQNNKNHENTIQTLKNLAEKGIDISPTLPALEKILENKTTSTCWSAAGTIAFCAIQKNNWQKLADLLQNPHDSIRNATLQALANATAKNKDISPLIPNIITTLTDNYAANTTHAASTLESFLKQKPGNSEHVQTELNKPDSPYSPKIKKIINQLETVARCEICHELPAYFSVNVDDPLPPPAKKLIDIFNCKADCPGIDDFGFAKCPNCGCIYYNESEMSLTGSQMNDYHHFYRLTPDEIAPISILLAETQVNAGNHFLTLALEKITAYIHSATYRGNNAATIIFAVLKFLRDGSENPYKQKLADTLKNIPDDNKSIG